MFKRNTLFKHIVGSPFSLLEFNLPSQLHMEQRILQSDNGGHCSTLLALVYYHVVFLILHRVNHHY